MFLRDLNINSLDYYMNTNACGSFNYFFQNGAFPLINKPWRVTISTTTIIDHVVANTTTDSEAQSSITKNRYKESLCCVCLEKNKFGTIKY